MPQQKRSPAPLIAMPQTTPPACLSATDANRFSIGFAQRFPPAPSPASGNGSRTDSLLRPGGDTIAGAGRALLCHHANRAGSHPAASRSNRAVSPSTIPPADCENNRPDHVACSWTVPCGSAANQNSQISKTTTSRASTTISAKSTPSERPLERNHGSRTIGRHVWSGALPKWQRETYHPTANRSNVEYRHKGL